MLKVGSLVMVTFDGGELFAPGAMGLVASLADDHGDYTLLVETDYKDSTGLGYPFGLVPTDAKEGEFIEITPPSQPTTA